MLITNYVETCYLPVKNKQLSLNEEKKKTCFPTRASRRIQHQRKSELWWRFMILLTYSILCKRSNDRKPQNLPSLLGFKHVWAICSSKGENLPQPHLSQTHEKWLYGEFMRKSTTIQQWPSKEHGITRGVSQIRIWKDQWWIIVINMPQKTYAYSRSVDSHKNSINQTKGD